MMERVVSFSTLAEWQQEEHLMISAREMKLSSKRDGMNDKEKSAQRTLFCCHKFSLTTCLGEIFVLVSSLVSIATKLKGFTFFNRPIRETNIFRNLYMKTLKG